MTGNKTAMGVPTKKRWKHEGNGGFVMSERGSEDIYVLTSSICEQRLSR